MAEAQLRPATEADAPAIADVCNARSRDLYGEADVDADAVAMWFKLPDISMFLVERNGSAVGYADVRSEDDGARFDLDVRVHPEARGSGVAGMLLAAAEAWAAERAHGGARLRSYAAERDDDGRAALEQHGFHLVRHSFTMEIELPESPTPPDWPPGVVVRTYDTDRDEEAVYECAEESFADHWDFHPMPLELWRTFIAADPRFDPELWWLVEDGDELAAVCLNFWHFSGDPTFGWVGTLGVRRSWRRRGLGLALLRQSFVDFKQRGATRVGLGVDAENTTGAVRLYERAGMHPVRRNDAYDRVLDG